MSDEIKNTEALIEDDKEYEDILEKFETPKDSSSSPKKKNTHIKALVIAVIAAVVLIGAGALLIFLPNGDKPNEINGSAAVKNDVKNNVHEVNVKTDSNGKIKENGKGELVKKYPADITRIDVKNQSGSYSISSYTPKKKTKETDPKTGKKKEKTEATVYKLIGYEDFKLQDGIADEVANACAALEFNSVSSEDASSNLADFGFDKPRAEVTVTYSDKTKSIFKVGKDAAQNLGTYVMFGSGKSVFLCDKDKVAKFLYDKNKYISLTINENASDNNSGEVNSLTLSGSKFKRNITLKPNPDTKHVAASNILTAPIEAYADDSEASTVTGAIRGLFAESVAALNPSPSKLSSCGLTNPYVKLNAVYPDTTENLLVSKPDSKGNCFLMKSGGKIVYKIASSSIPWVNTSEKKLISNYVFNPELSGLKKMSVSFGKDVYDFDIKTTETKSTDDNGEETSTTDTSTSYKGEKLDEGNFETFFKNAALLTKAEKYAKAKSGKPALTIKYTYTSGRNPDTVAFYKSGSKYIACVNSKPVGTVYSNYIEKLISQTPKVAKDEEVKTFW